MQHLHRPGYHGHANGSILLNNNVQVSSQVLTPVLFNSCMVNILPETWQDFHNSMSIARRLDTEEGSSQILSPLKFVRACTQDRHRGMPSWSVCCQLCYLAQLYQRASISHSFASTFGRPLLFQACFTDNTD